MRSAVIFWFLLLAVSWGQAALPPGTRYVMSHFGNDEGRGGDERLYISVSPDAVHWTALNNDQPVYAPPGWHPFGNVVRDPAIIYHRGFYWVAYTSGMYGWRSSSSEVKASFGLAKSADLLNWTYVGEVSTVPPGATDPLTWSPTFFRDGDGSVHVFVAIRPHGGGSFSPVPGMRVHELHPLNDDWSQWSAPTLVDLPSTNSNELWVWKDRATYHGLFVDFTRSGSPYIHVTSTDPVQGWSNPQDLGFHTQEGAFLLKRPDGGYRLYSERGNTSTSPTYLYADCDAKLENFGPQTFVSSTKGMRNGKAIAVAPQQTYAQWSATLPATWSDPLLDLDGDGSLNLLEFASGGDPLVPGAPSLLRADPHLATITTLRANGAAVDLQLEATGVAGVWQTGTSGLSLLATMLRTDGTEELVWQDAARAGAAQRSYRLRATVAASASTFTPAKTLALAPRTISPAVAAKTPATVAVRAVAAAQLRARRLALQRRQQLMHLFRRHQALFARRQVLQLHLWPLLAY